MWWTWLVISIITKNKPHAHHKIYLNTMKIYNTWPVSLTIKVLHKDSSFFRSLKYALVPSRVQEARALKRAGSSNLAVMQESGYYQSDKTRWQTLYWTIREIIQQKVSHYLVAFICCKQQRRNKLFFLTFVLCFVLFFPREQISVLNKVPPPWPVLKFHDLVRK